MNAVDGQPENIMPSPDTVGWRWHKNIKTLKTWKKRIKTFVNICIKTLRVLHSTRLYLPRYKIIQTTK